MSVKRFFFSGFFSEKQSRPNCHYYAACVKERVVSQVMQTSIKLSVQILLQIQNQVSRMVP